MAKKNMKRLGRRGLATLLTLIMVFSMVNITALAADQAPELVKNYADTYYKQDGTAGTAEDWEIHLSKQAAATQTDNVYDITLTVETKDTSVMLGGATHGAVTLVLDVSNSMDEAPDGCAVCGKSENHADHRGASNLCPDGSGNSYRRSIFGGNRCINCDKRRNAHIQGEPVCRYEEANTHLEELQGAVSAFLDSYVANVSDGDKRLVSVAVFGTDAVTIQSWVDVTDASNRAAVKNLVNSLKTGNGAYRGNTYLTNGGTNIEAGLVLGRNLLNDTGALAGIPAENQSLILFSDGAPTAKVGSVSNTSTSKVGYGGSDTGTSTDYSDYDDIGTILKAISAATIAVKYNYSDSNGVLSGFDRVISSTADTLSVDLTGEAGKVITTVTTPTVVTDPMGEGVSMVTVTSAYNGTSETWNLADCTPAVADGITTYTITYQVQIDPTKVDADPACEGYTILTPANGTTTLDYTVGEHETPVEAEFNVPDIRGKLPKFALTVNYVDEQGAAIADQIVESGILYGKPYATEQKDIEGYTFEKLAEGSDAVSGTVNADKTVTYVYSKNPIPKYTVTYEYINAPEGAPALPEAAQYEAGAAVTVAAAPELEGYTFSGWDKENFEMPAEDVVIKGSWTAIPKYTVTYEYINAPEGAPALPETREYAAGAAVTVAAAAYLEGYIFSGWDKENFEMPAEDVVIKGSWTVIPPELYNVVYQYEGEIPEGAPALPEAAQYEAGAAVTVAAAPELEGYTFSGWDKENFEMPAEDVIIKGSWTAIPKYTVTYEYINAPEGAPALPEAAQYEAGAAVTVAAAPELEGYTFSGWDKENFEMPAEDVVIKGSWTEIVIPKYTVSYEYIDTVPANAPAAPAPAQYVAGAAVTVAAAPELEGYTFSGWDKENFEMPAEDVVIKGSWIKDVPPPPVTVVEAEGEFVITFDKAVAGDDYRIAANDFIFRLVDTDQFKDGSGFIRLGENAVGRKTTYTAKNDAAGKVTFTVPFFKDLEGWEATGYTAVGTYVYTLSEVSGAIEGMSYDASQYTILVRLHFEQKGKDWSYRIDQVSVIHNGGRQVTAQYGNNSSVITLSLGEEALYTNTFTQPEPPVGQLIIRKTIVGTTKTPAELAFRVTGPDGFEEVVLYSRFVDGAYTLRDLTPGKYTVTEENAVIFGYWFTAEGEGDVNVPANGEAQINITNTYNKRTTPYIPPVTPEPQVPETPEIPEIPETPEIPEIPEVPEVPETPETPEIPDEPIDIPEDDVPLADVPELPVEIPEEDVPLADVPKTGDLTAVYKLMAMLSGLGLAWLALSGRKRETV